jgi:hypothetical protein
MASSVRYRYKGLFVSEAKARKIQNLQNAKKFLTTETVKPDRKTDRVSRGFKESIEKQVLKAIAKDRSKAEEKRAMAAQARVKEMRRDETPEMIEIARDIARIASENDISIEEAADVSGYDPDDFDTFGPDDIFSAAHEMADYGGELFDFEMADLEEEEDYPEH